MSVAIVLIGRNEGARLSRVLASVSGQADRIIYVDSGSVDDSVRIAHTAGAQIVELDSTTPFSAARARNAGFKASQKADAATFVQFVDGDCLMRPDWLRLGLARLQQDEKLGLVTGWRSEEHRNASVYNQMCDHEWHRPAGQITTCGGDMLVRADAFSQVGGFDPQVIAAEDDEFCLRLGQAGWQLERLPADMTLHDASITRFGQWWRRATRAGHGFAQVGALHPHHFRKERMRTIVFGALLPLIAVAGMWYAPRLVVFALLIYSASYVRTVRGLRREGLPKAEALHHSFFLLLSKFPNLIGMATFWLRRLQNRPPHLIEYR